MFGDLRPKGGQHLGEFDQVLVFRGLSRLAVVGVVAILLAPFCVATGGLNVSIREWTNSDIGPGWRNDERAYALKSVGVCHPPALRIEIDKAIARAPAPN